MIWVLGALVAAAALLLLGGGSGRRLRSLVAGTGPRGASAAPSAPEPSAASTEDALASIAEAAALLRIGLTANECFAQLALTHAGTTLGRAWDYIARTVTLGQPVRVAIVRHIDEFPPDSRAYLRQVAAAWSVAESSGAPLAGVLTSCAAAAREDMDTRNEKEVALAGPRSTVTVLTWLPIIGLGLGMGIGADPVSLIRETPWGGLVLGGGIALLVAGRWWMSRMMRTQPP